MKTKLATHNYMKCGQPPIKTAHNLRGSGASEELACMTCVSSDRMKNKCINIISHRPLQVYFPQLFFKEKVG